MFTRNDLKQLFKRHEAQIIIEYGYDQKVAQPEIIVRLRNLRKAQTSEKDHRSKRQQDCLPSVLEAIFAPLLDNLKNESLEKPSHKQLMGWFCKIYEECDVSEDPYKQLDLRLEGGTLNAPTKTHIRELFTLFHINAKILRLVFAPLFKEVQTTLNQTVQEAKTDLTSAQAPEGSSYLSSAPEVPAETAFIEPKIIYFEVRQIQWFNQNCVYAKAGDLQAAGVKDNSVEYFEALRAYIETPVFKNAQQVVQSIRKEVSEVSEEQQEAYLSQQEGLYLFLEALFNLPKAIEDEKALLNLMEKFLAIFHFSVNNPIKSHEYTYEGMMRALIEVTKKTVQFKDGSTEHMSGSQLDRELWEAIQKGTNELLKMLLMEEKVRIDLSAFVLAVQAASSDLRKKLGIPAAVSPISTPTSPMSRGSAPVPRYGAIERAPGPSRHPISTQSVRTSSAFGRVTRSLSAAVASCCGCSFFPRNPEAAAAMLGERRSVTAKTVAKAVTQDAYAPPSPGPS